MDKERLKKGFSRLFPALLNRNEPPAAEPVLYLHIGMPKTGTTAIQRFLFENRNIIFEKQGALYPDYAMGWYQQVPVVKSIVRSCFPQAIFNKTIIDVEVDNWLSTLRVQCEAGHCRKIIVSSEYLWAAPAMQTHLEYHTDTDENFSYIEDVIAKTRETFSEFSNVKIVVYLRRQDTWLESFFNQQIKIGAVIPDEDAVMPVKNYLLYAKNLRVWHKYFGQENVIVRFYESVGSDIVNDFCRIVDIDTAGLSTQNLEKSEISNPSLSPRAVKVMREAIEKQVGQDLLENMRIVLTGTSAVSMSGSKKPRYSVFSKPFHDQVLSHYRHDTDELVNMYPDSAMYLSNDEDSAREDLPSREEKDYSWEDYTELLLEKLITKL